MDYVKEDTIHIHKDNVVREPDKKYVDCRGTPLSECTCDLRLRVTAKECSHKRVFVAHRFEGKRRIPLAEMWDKLASQLSAAYRMVDGKIYYNEHHHDFNSASETIRNMAMVNCVPIPPVTKASIPRMNHELSPHPHLMKSYKLWDVKWLSSYIGPISPRFMAANVWHSSKFGDTMYHHGVPRSIPLNADQTGYDVPPLRVLALRAVSAFNRALSYDSDGPKSIFTMSQAYPGKKIKEIQKMNRPTHDTGRFLKTLFTKIPDALEVMYTMTGWSVMKKGATFYWTPQLLDKPHYPQRSSSGWRPGPRIEVNLAPNHIIVFHTVGMKMEQLPYAKMVLQRWVDDVRQNGPRPLDDSYWVLTDKYEVLGSEDPVERKKLLEKLRQFNIPTVVIHMAAVVVHGMRQKLERGDHIRVGMQWNYGGAQHLADLLDYNDMDAIVDAADFSRYDKSISKLLLDLYSSSASYYYDERGDFQLYSDLLEAVASALSVKVTNILGDVWRVVIGNMPSGAYETSHGDSWINLFLFVLYTVWVSERMPPPLARQMRADIISRVVMYVVYGDDHLCKYPSKYYPWLNVHKRKKWLYRYFDMTLRDCEVFRAENGTPALITRIDSGSGRILKRGPVFLQHYFVYKTDVGITLKDACQVVPYRVTFKTFYKFPFGSGAERLPVDYAMAAIGHAYDTKGTNDTAYQFCVHQFNYFASKCDDFWHQVEHEWKKDDKYVNKLCQKAGVTQDILMRGFPTLEQLHRLHVMDRDKHRNYARELFEQNMNRREIFGTDELAEHVWDM